MDNTESRGRFSLNQLADLFAVSTQRVPPLSWSMQRRGSILVEILKGGFI